MCLLNCLFRKWHHAWLLHFFLHKQKKRSSHHVTPEENVPFWFIYCEVSTDIFSFNTNWKKSLICRKSQLHFFSFSSQIISMPLYIQLCYWKIKKKLKEMFLQFNSQLLKHDLNLQYIYYVLARKARKNLCLFTCFIGVKPSYTWPSFHPATCNCATAVFI